MLTLEFYETYLDSDTVHFEDENICSIKIPKDKKIYDLRSVKDYINSLPCAKDYDLNIYSLVHCLKYLITNRVTPLECRGLRSVKFLGAKMTNRFDNKDTDHLVVGNRRVSIENMQILDLSLTCFLHDRFETMQVISNLKALSLNNELTLQHLMRLSFPTKYEKLFRNYVLDFQPYLSSNLNIGMSKEVFNHEDIITINVVDTNTNQTVDLTTAQLRATDFAIILLPYLFMYEGVTHRTVFIDTTTLPDDLISLILKFVRSKMFNPQTIVLY